MTTRPEEAFNLSPLYCIYTIEYIFSLLTLSKYLCLAVRADRFLKLVKTAAVLLQGNDGAYDIT